MSDTIGRITVPTVPDSGVVFPLTTDWDYAFSQARPVIRHPFGSANAKIEQRFEVGIGPNRYGFKRALITRAQRANLMGFWENRQGAYATFLYNAPQPDGTTSQLKVNFENQPITFPQLLNGCSVGMTFVEVPDPSTAPTYPISSTCLRFPSDALSAALLSQTQKVIPLIHIRPTECNLTGSTLPDNIYLSDRLCTIGSQKYIARLLNVGDPQSDTLISCDISGQPESVRFVFGNADRVMTALANDTRLKGALIQFSLFHVNTGILLNLWAGQIVDYESNAGAEFSVHCSDPLWDPHQQFPVRQVDRTCWKSVGDQITCHATAGSTCDRSWANCGALGRQQEFGGVLVNPQGVNILDNSSGTVGFGRNSVTATSIVSDTIYGYPLADIWIDDGGDPIKSMPVNCLVASVRDEGDFWNALAIVGAGPLGAYTTPQMVYSGDGLPKKDLMISPMLDGSPFQGFKVDSSGNPTSQWNATVGLRQVLGADPVVDSGADHGYFSMGQTMGGTQVWTDNSRAAGVAFIEIRIPKPSGINPTAPEAHQVQAVVSRGLTGRTWTAPGVTSDWSGCVDPFWVAVNTLIRGLGLNLASSSVQEQYFDVNAAISCAAVAGDMVDTLVGTGTERQFAFKGTVGGSGTAAKALREWIRDDILAGALGYFTWSYGKMRLGMRINASVSDAFTIGNMIFGSLTLRPIKPRFEKMVISFADEEYRYQANTATYTDFDMAALNGRPLTPTQSQMHLAGCASKSQALRLAVTKVREENGGCYRADLIEHGGDPLSEYKAACEGTFKTTILALSTEPGKVISLTHPDLVSSANPTGYGKFRITGWRLMRDYSIQEDIRIVTDSMYDLEVGPPMPADVKASPIPAEPTVDTDIPPAPTFAVEASALDSTVAEISGLSFPAPENTISITSATFALYFVDESAGPSTTLSADMGLSDVTISLASSAHFPSGSLALIDGELVLIGASNAITRAQFGSAADAHSNGATVLLVQRRVSVGHFAIGFFTTTEASSWLLSEALPNMKLVSVEGYVSNAYGDSPVTDVCLTSGSDHGLRLTAPAAGSSQIAIYNLDNNTYTHSTGSPAITGTGTVSDPFILAAVEQTVNISATSQEVYVKIPTEASMVGVPVTAKLNNGSTLHAHLVASGSDTGDGFSFPIDLTSAGESITVIGE